MIRLSVFILALAAFAVADLRAMYRDGARRDMLVYAILCAAVIAAAAIYFPSIHRRSVMHYLLILIGNGG